MTSDFNFDVFGECDPIPPKYQSAHTRLCDQIKGIQKLINSGSHLSYGLLYRANHAVYSGGLKTHTSDY